MQETSLIGKIDNIVLKAFLIFFKICRVLFFFMLICGMGMEALDVSSYAKSLSISVVFSLLLNAFIMLFLLIFAFGQITKSKILILGVIIIGYVSMYFISEDMLYMSKHRQCVEGSLTNCPEDIRMEMAKQITE